MALPIVESIKEKLSINKVLGFYLKKDKSLYGNIKYKCPFHGDGNERTPSLYASDERGSYYCFGCHAKGDIFNFVQTYDKNHQLNFGEAIEELKDTFPEELADIDISFGNGLDDKEYKYKKNIYSFHEELNNKMIELLNHKRNINIKKYLLIDRKLSEETIGKFNIGFSEGRIIEDYANKLLKEKYKEIKKEDTGLYSTKKKDKPVYFLFSNRIMFPIFNNRRKIVGWSGGRIYDDQNPKYINSINNYIYNKSANLFNIDKVQFSETDTLIICEGNLDSTQLYNYGANNAVSLLGTNLTDTQIKLFNKKIKKVILLLDNDEAGNKATQNITKQLLKEGIIPYIVNISPEKDIDDFLKARDELKGNIGEYLEKNKKDVLSDFLIKGYVLNKDKVSLEHRYQILATIKEIYSEISDDIIRIIYKDELKKYEIEFENLEKEYKEKKKNDEKMEKDADKINKEQILNEKWEKDKYILYAIYLISKGIISEEMLASYNMILSLEIQSIEDYEIISTNYDEFIKKYPTESIEFDLVGIDKQKELLSIT